MTLTPRRRIAVFAPAAALALAATRGTTNPSTGQATAPGSSSAAVPTSAAPTSMPSMDLVAKMKTSMAAPTSVHLKASGLASGKSSSFDLNGKMDGSNGTFAITTGDTSFTVLKATNAYVKANQAFWAVQAGVDAAKVADKWVKMPDSLKPQLDAITPRSMLDALTKDMTADKLAPQATRDQLDGTDVYVIVDAKGIAEGQLYVDAKTFLPVKYTQSKNNSVATFTDWDAAATATEPAAGEIVSP